MNKYLYFEGVKFTRDDKTGYYLNSTLHKRMHRYVWEYYNGAIPKGYQIHHKDHNRANNNIENLEMLPTSTHAKKHGDDRANNHYGEMCDNLAENARPKAVEWHKSEAGIEWHKKHYQKTKDKFIVERTFVCEVCGKKFTSTQINSRFCSNLCKSQWRRNQGIDNEIRECKNCGKEFSCNKFSKTQYCSQTCVNLSHSKVQYIEKICPVCNKQFLTRVGKEKKTCSVGCSNKYRTINKKAT